MGNYTETDAYEFDVVDPALLSYAEGDVSAVVGSNSQSWEARIVYPNPGGAGSLMRINSITARFLHPGSAMLRILEYVDGSFTPLMQPLEVFFPDADNTIDISDMNILVTSPRFMISLSQIPAYNYIRVMGPSTYADMNFLVLDSEAQSFPAMDIYSVYEISAEVQTSIGELAAPQLSISLCPTGIELSWPPVPGATAYKVHVSDDPYGVGTWSLIDTTEDSSYIYPSTQAKRFFSVTSVRGSDY